MRQCLLVDEFIGGEASAAFVLGSLLQGDDAAAGVLESVSEVVDRGAWVGLAQWCCQALEDDLVCGVVPVSVRVWRGS